MQLMENISRMLDFLVPKINEMFRQFFVAETMGERLEEMFELITFFKGP